MEHLAELWLKVKPVFENPHIASAVRAAITLIIGIAVARWVSGTLVAGLAARITDVQRRIMVRRLAYWGILAMAAVSALRELGFDLSVLLGAAGVLTVAIGFASQTSASNLISGLFLYGERPFTVGDTIRIGDTTGEVLTVDLLSTKLRTFDNLFVRIPNETVMKAEVVNLTRFPLRRFDLLVGIAYDEDIERVRVLLYEVAEKNPAVLKDPNPVFILSGFGDSSINLQFSVWGQTSRFLELRNTFTIDVHRAFAEHGVEIPFPQRVVHRSEDGDPARPAASLPTKTEPESGP
ncbi:MAG: mechanosensitive ion channel family protein [Acidobacteria bacterium]|nr:mechanosensitive ion channel family protein [Acidobacteriota bacterium]